MVTVAPAATLTDREYQIMRDASIAVLSYARSGLRLAIIDPKDGRMLSSR